MTGNYRLIVLLPIFIIALSAYGQPKTDPLLQQLLDSAASPLLKHILQNKDSFQYQIIYTCIDRDSRNRPHFRNYYCNVDRGRYFNPASTVKLPTALAALQKINALRRKGIDKTTAMLTDSAGFSQSTALTDSSSNTGLPSVSHYIKKIFLVSDNDAYNRLYEFVGQQELNEDLKKKGYTDVRITRRFTAMTPDENRHTNPIRFVKAGKPIYSQPAAYSSFHFDFTKPVLIGKAHYDKNEKLVQAPMDFTSHNNFPLQGQQLMLQSVMFPRSVKRSKRFRLPAADYRFLYHFMSAYPYESRSPAYDTTVFFSSYAKFFYKDKRRSVPAGIRIFNKPGWSYGFLTDAAYVVDFDKEIEYMLSAVIYVNKDGILNDDKYEYETIGYPFFHEINQIIYNYELARKRKYAPDLNVFRFIPEDEADY